MRILQKKAMNIIKNIAAAAGRGFRRAGRRGGCGLSSFFTGSGLDERHHVYYGYAT
jgi:hypothetical protein